MSAIWGHAVFKFERGRYSFAIAGYLSASAEHKLPSKEEPNLLLKADIDFQLVVFNRKLGQQRTLLE